MTQHSIKETLFNSSIVGDKTCQESILEQYKMCVSATENISNRRQTTNSFFISINTIIVSFVSYFNFQGDDKVISLVILSIAGIIASFMWRQLILLYKALNSAKFLVILEIEKQLPLAPYTAEWQALEEGQNKQKYKPFTSIESQVPIIFMVLHLLVAFFNLNTFLNS
ncbi:MULTISPECIES: RipA family octameric membrane protein [Alteromonadaceae]|uniref:RipA family octameric membrane protein n=1 Tax=Alteromonadaceae TaxID=72275 RepID=UPI001C09A1A5|nr:MULTISPECIES: hypothetical protein [Aliiglaciecola]MBU2878116.1 hypothetical protein [Aliiglaciecola lipolytica]MDO6711564.1 hypothetical protein [Aliiglaciecola sp. 2_MG-2023]MDO6752635.1 hypothetical protein [Aliiglaciecola sp. 1_MG-2023]